MDLIDYVLAVIITWFVGFFPYFETYVAIPLGYSLGLNWFNSFIWASLGDWMAIPFIDFVYNYLLRFEFIRKNIDKSLSSKWKKHIDRYGVWFILVITPIAGSWTIGLMGKSLKYDKTKLYLYTGISIAITGLITILLIEMGKKIVF